MGEWEPDDVLIVHIHKILLVYWPKKDNEVFLIFLVHSLHCNSPEMKVLLVLRESFDSPVIPMGFDSLLVNEYT